MIPSRFSPSHSLSYQIFGYNLYEPLNDLDINDPSIELRVETSEVFKYLNDNQIENVYQLYDAKNDRQLTNQDLMN